MNANIFVIVRGRLLLIDQRSEVDVCLSTLSINSEQEMKERKLFQFPYKNNEI